MNKSIFFVLVSLLGAITACTHHDAPVSSNSATASFAALQSSVISAKCTVCHSGTSASAGLDFSDYNKLLSSGTIVPGQPSQSSFLTAISNGTMPPGAPLSPDLVQNVRAWIQNGAKQDADLALASITPSSAASGTQVSITLQGQGFQPSSAVQFNHTPAASLSYSSSNQMTAVSPVLEAGSYDVSVTNPDGTNAVLKGALTVGGANGNAGLTITKIFPNSGSSGTLIEIDGSGFVNTTIVSVAGQSCSGIVVTPPNQITCTTPRNDQSGAVDVVVTNPDGTSFPFVNGYSYTVSAGFTSILKNTFVPKCLSCHGATSTLSGGLSLVGYTQLMSSGAVVPRDPADSLLYTYVSTHKEPRAGTNGTPPPLSDTEISTIYNWILNGAYDDTPPSVISIDHSVGSTNGGTDVTITGTRFLPGATVNIGNAACTPATVDSSGTKVECLTSPRAAGVVDVVVINPANGGIPSQASTGGVGLFTYQDGPTLTKIVPNTAKSSTQSPVTLYGKNFTSGSTFKFGNLNCTGMGTPSCDASHNCSVTCVPPPQPAAVVTVRITNPDAQFFDLANGFSFTAGDPPVLNSLSPTFSYTGQSKTVTFSGSGFLPGASPQIGGKACSNPTVTPTQITCSINTGLKAGSQSAVVTNPDNLSSATIAYDLRQMIMLDAKTPVSPTSGSVNGGNFIVITGAGFVSGASVTVGGKNCTSLQFNSSTSLVCVVPAQSTLSATPLGVDIVVTNPADETGTKYSATGKGIYFYTLP